MKRSFVRSVVHILKLLRRSSEGGDDLTRRSLDVQPSCLYAIGDVHGHLHLLLELERLIAEDAGDKERSTIILLGDMVDRGPNSAQVLDHVLERQAANPDYLCLRGNHEQAMLDYVRTCDPDDPWLRHGGRETLLSYGIVEAQLRTRREARDAVAASVPQEHLSFLSSLPHVIETPSHYFSHAGVNPARPLTGQTTSDVLWFKDEMVADYAQFEKVVVHGHEAVSVVSASARRINVDTGAYATGRLSAVCIKDNHSLAVLAAERSSMRQTN